MEYSSDPLCIPCRQHTQGSVKSCTPIVPDVELTLPLPAVGHATEEVRYALLSVGQHPGQSFNCGHWTSVVRVPLSNDPSGIVCTFNDIHVTVHGNSADAMTSARDGCLVVYQRVRAGAAGAASSGAAGNGAVGSSGAGSGAVGSSAASSGAADSGAAGIGAGDAAVSRSRADSDMPAMDSCSLGYTSDACETSFDSDSEYEYQSD